MDVLGRFRRQIENMTRWGNKPHKPIMLLAVLDMMDTGEIVANRIVLSDKLVERFTHIFEILAGPGDRCQPALPFYHLRSSEFWTLVPNPGKEEDCKHSSTLGAGIGKLRQVVAYARLDDELYRQLQDTSARADIRHYILRTFFGEVPRARLDPLIKAPVTASADDDSRIAEEMGSHSPQGPTDGSFADKVLAAYDYRCALCGLRILIPDVRPPVEAAYLVPPPYASDDSVGNGIALCRLHLWAFDSALMAPTPEYQWRASSCLDPRRDSERELLRYDGESVLLPDDRNLWPIQERLVWRTSRLRNCSNSPGGAENARPG